MAQVRIGPRVELRVEPPVRAVLVDLVVVTVASMLFGSAIGLITNALDRRIRQHAPRAVGAALFALAAAAAFFPFWLNWQVRASFMVFFATASHGVLIFFKTVEVLCGTLPAGLDRSLRAWVVYFACDAEMKFAAVERAGAGAREEENDAASSQAKHRRHAPGPLPSPPLLRVLPELCVRVAGFMALQSALLHVGALCDWRPFRPRLGAVGSVLDVYFWATLLWACAEWVTALARIALHLCGFDSIAAFRLPLFRSTSPREFWSKRWNLIIHKLMHRTYFAPVARATGSPTLGALSAFVASALFHEYMWAVAVHPLAKDGMVIGEVTLFFCAQFALCSLELLAAAMLPKPFVARVSQLPRAVKVACTALLICSFGEFFCGNLLRAGMFSSMQDMHAHVTITIDGRNWSAPLVAGGWSGFPLAKLG